MNKNNRRHGPTRRPGSAAQRAETDRALWPSQRGQDHLARDVLPPGLERPDSRLAVGGGRHQERRVPGGEDRAARVGPADGGLAGRDRAEAPALSRPRAIRPDRQGLPGRARHARQRGADPGVLRGLRCRVALPRPRGLGRARRAPAAAAGSRKPAGALYRSLRRPEHGPAGRALIDQVRPGAGQQRGRGDGPGVDGRSLDRVRRATGRRAVWDDAPRAGGARAGRGDFRGELVWPERQRQPAAGGAATPWDWRDR